MNFSTPELMLEYPKDSTKPIDPIAKGELISHNEEEISHHEPQEGRHNKQDAEGK